MKLRVDLCLDGESEKDGERCTEVQIVISTKFWSEPGKAGCEAERLHLHSDASAGVCSALGGTDGFTNATPPKTDRAEI